MGMFLKDLRSRNFEYSDMWLTGSLQQEDGLVSKTPPLAGRCSRRLDAQRVSFCRGRPCSWNWKLQ